ncbi:MAG: IPT/TIG domain-containing protein [Gemmatimonadetes bacterium]|nr:IPT/TIG domain-containing protein [Gemmatimonadota bacterium]
MRKGFSAAAIVFAAAACSDGGTTPKVVPAPVLTSVTPSELPVSSNDATLTFIGSGFQKESVTRMDSVGLATTYVSESELRATVPGWMLEKGRVAPVSVFTLAAGKTSEVVNVTIAYAAPTLGSLSHDTATAGRPNPSPVTVTGTGFSFGTQVVWNGQPLTTLYQTPTTVIFTPVVTTPGVYPVFVRNPTPGGGSSATTTFTVRSQP